MRAIKVFAIYFIIMAIYGCQGNQVDLILYNAKIYTVDKDFSVAEALAVKDGKIVAVGTNNEIRKFKAEIVEDAKGRAIFPGFIDAHAHFFGYAESLDNANLVGTSSWYDVLGKMQDFAKTKPTGWLTGRGWDQNDWPIKQFPTRAQLDILFPDRPVLLTRIDGHAAIANKVALDIAGIKKVFAISGGEIVADGEKPSGVLIDNAISLVSSKVPALTSSDMTALLMKAQQNCFAVGLTTIDDCGLDFNAVEKVEQLHKKNELKMRLYIMLADEEQNYKYLIKRGAIKTERLNVRSFKVFADGALGSRGACLLHSYNDMPGKKGFLLSDLKHFENVARVISENNFQMCTHAIGDSANRAILKIYNKILPKHNDRRWRIEHAQVINKADFNLFGAANIIPSVQPTHATSDMYWAGDRLGTDRVKGAYAYKQLLNQNGWIPLGTDFPVEQINPMLTFYAATKREDADGFPKGGFQIQNALTPVEALKGMTIWAAKANFEEKEKGSIEVGKFADFVIMENDFMKGNASQVLKNKVLRTYVNGEKVFDSKKKL